MQPTTLSKSLSLLCVALLLASCTSRETLPPGLSGPREYVRPVQDGAPWWYINAEKIPDAIPVPHLGSYKNQSYRVRERDYFPLENAIGYVEEGEASWYGTRFHGNLTAIQEPYDLYGMTAAHKTLPLPAYVRVTNLENGRQVVVRVNDRGPFHSDRIIDLSYGAAVKLGFAAKGVARVRVEAIDPVQWWSERGRTPPPPQKEPLRKEPALSRVASEGEIAGLQPRPVEPAQQCPSRWASSPAELLRQRTARTAGRERARSSPAS